MGSGVYKITNLVNGKIYIGQSIDVENRLNEHKRNYKHNQHLTNAINKYGVDKFTFELLIATDIKYLNRLEKLFIRKYDTMNPDKGYNKDSGGNANYVISDETRKKMSDAKMGDKNPKYWKGKKRSAESIRKTAEGNKGKTRSDEQRLNIIKGMGKDYARIIKNGFQNNKQMYQIRFKGKCIKRSIYIHKLINWWNENYPTEPLHIEVN